MPSPDVKWLKESAFWYSVPWFLMDVKSHCELIVMTKSPPVSTTNPESPLSTVMGKGFSRQQKRQARSEQHGASREVGISWTVGGSFRAAERLDVEDWIGLIILRCSYQNKFA
jgi:hypothetical protein